uniref:Uncharacterized protein LOC111101469 n=1 Tax=Crassostrea virginica TaxID=6565 RepID=A0A8B8AES8_CRAVI|nr:uncharacterized protein LOC111101469 [Crassostrea virginica]
MSQDAELQPQRWSIFARLGTSEVTVGLNAYIHRMARNIKKYVIVVKIYATSQLDVRKKRRRVLLDILDTCVKRSVFILIMARSVKVTAIVVKTCVTSPMDANLLLKMINMQKLMKIDVILIHCCQSVEVISSKNNKCRLGFKTSWLTEICV